MSRRFWDVLNEYKAELLPWWMAEMITVSTEISPAPSKAQMNRKATNSHASKLTPVKRREYSLRCERSMSPKKTKHPLFSVI